MHGGRGAASAGLLALLPSCASLHADKHTYEASSPAVEVGGAKIRMQVRPEGADNAFSVSAMVVSTTVATLDGPFRWRIEATGEPGRQEKLIVRRIRTRTAVTKRDEWFPASELNRYANFKPQDGGTTRALYPIPGMLKVKPRSNGTFENSALRSGLDEPPVPVPVGSPVCAMKPGITRWKTTPS